MTAVPIIVTPDGTAIEYGTAQPLFPWPGQHLGRDGTLLPPYAVSGDGRRFLIAASPIETSTTPLSLILNWRAP